MFRASVKQRIDADGLGKVSIDIHLMLQMLMYMFDDFRSAYA